MVGRLIACLVLVAGLGAIVWVVVTGGGADADRADADRADTDSGAAPAPSDAAAPTGRAGATPTPFPEPPNLGPRMDLVDIDGWLQTNASSIDDFDGTVLLVEMWTFGCHNCKARIPHTQSYAEEFAGENFAILGVHAPEFAHEADVDNIVVALDRLGVTWPQALDTDLVNFRAWQPGRTNYWPRTYVIDQNGDIRYDHIGEGGYDELRETIRHLLDHPPQPRT